MTVRNDIKKLLKKDRRTIADLARAIKINYEVLNRKLNGRSSIDDKLEKKIAKTFKSWGVVGFQTKPK